MTNESNSDEHVSLPLFDLITVQVNKFLDFVFKQEIRCICSPPPHATDTPINQEPINITKFPKRS